MRSLWPPYNYPNPNIIIGVTLMIVMMTMEDNTNRLMVDSERQLINRFDLMLTVQFFRSVVIIIFCDQEIKGILISNLYYLIKDCHFIRIHIINYSLNGL
jgi:hypothetical protein